MKLIAWKDIHWDIVKSTFPSPSVFGWPISAHVSTSQKLVRFEKITDGRYGSGPKYVLEFRIPFTPMITWTWDGKYHKDKMYPTVSYKTVMLFWNGFFYFWQA